MSLKEVPRCTVADVFAFSHDASPEIIWECFGFDAPWNGWASPIVDRETVIDLLEDAGWWYRTEGESIFLASEETTDDEEIVMLQQDDEAHYHLRDLGWTFMEAKAYNTKVLPFKANDRN